MNNMIAYLRGKIIQKKDNFIVLDIGGVGYLVAVPQNEALGFSIGKEIEIYTYLAVRENALDLYGSANNRVVEWFEMLLNVNGIGPKSALSVVSYARPEDLSAAISSSSSEILINCGVGKKISESIVLELKNKAKNLIDIKDGKIAKSLAADSEAIVALEALGYHRERAREALKQVEAEDVESKIRGALRVLSK